MQQKIIKLDFSAGSIIFDEYPTEFNIKRTATGINLKIPAVINLEWPDRNKPQPMLTNLRATVSVKTSSSEGIEIGTARDDDYYTGSIPSSNSTAELIWPDALRGLLYIEKHRLDKQPQLELFVRGELCFIVKCAEYTEEDYRTRNQIKAYDVRTIPYRHIREIITVSYPIDVWENMMKTALGMSKDDPFLRLLPLTPFLSGKKI
jgi:hypothetical protein